MVSAIKDWAREYRGLRALVGVFRRTRRVVIGLLVLPLLPIIAPIMRLMGRSGVGTDYCYRRGVLPVPVHFYQPVPDLGELEKRDVWNQRTKLVGVNFRAEQQLELLKELGRNFGNECQWPAEAPSNECDFFVNNGGFSFGCAAATHSIIRQYHPKRILEVGSGNSSKVIAAAVQRDRVERNWKGTDYTVVDPYPHPVTGKLDGISEVIASKVEEQPFTLFETLGANDILFIDSSHVCRIGSDVNFLFLEILPRLAPGVIVHVHDIALPYEYSKSYATNPRFRVFWNEAYLFQAFMCFNSEFEVLLGMNYLQTDHPHYFQRAFVHYDPVLYHDVSHSFWIRRKLAPVCN